MRKQKGMYVIAAAAVVAAMLLMAVGCGTSSPSDAAENFMKAAQDKDCEKMVDLIDLDAPEFSGIDLSRDDLVQSCQQDAESGGEVTDYKVLEENIDGDTATVKVEVTTNDNGNENTSTTTFSMTKRDNEWKLGAGI